MIALVSGHSLQVDGFRGRVALGIIQEELLQCGEGITELPLVKMAFGHAEHQGRDQLFRCQEANGSVVFFTVSVQGDQGGCPLDIEVRGKGFGIKSNLDGDHVLVDELNDLRIRVRNCTHLLTTNSARVEEIEQDQFIFFPSPF